jgi:hypothetical protein
MLVGLRMERPLNRIVRSRNGRIVSRSGVISSAVSGVAGVHIRIHIPFGTYTIRGD